MDDILLKDVLDENNTLEVVINDMDTSQHTENWEFLFHKDECIGLLRGMIFYKRCDDDDGNLYSFTKDSHVCDLCKRTNEAQTIRLYRFDLEVRGEIRNHVQMGDYIYKDLVQYIRG